GAIHGPGYAGAVVEPEDVDAPAAHQVLDLGELERHPGPLEGTCVGGLDLEGVPEKAGRADQEIGPLPPGHFLNALEVWDACGALGLQVDRDGVQTDGVTQRVLAGTAVEAPGEGARVGEGEMVVARPALEVFEPLEMDQAVVVPRVHACDVPHALAV